MSVKKRMIPASIRNAEKLIRGLGADNAGEQYWDSVEDKLFVDCRKRSLTYRIRVRINKQNNAFTVGRTQDIKLSEVRVAAGQIRDYIDAGKKFKSQDEIKQLVYPEATKEKKTVDADAPTISEAFESRAEQLLAQGVVGSSSIDRYRSALESSGIGDLSLHLVDFNDLREIAVIFRSEKSASYYRNWRNAIELAWEWAARQDEFEALRIDPDVAVNLKGEKFDVEAAAPEDKTFLTFPQLAAFWNWLSDARCPFTQTQRRLYKIILLVGERIGALRESKWTDIGPDGWWVIMPNARKTQKKKEKKAKPLIIRVTEAHREIIGYDDGSSPYIFPAENDQNKPLPHGSEQIWNAFRVRAALQEGKICPPIGTKITLPSLMSNSMVRSTAKRERGVFRQFCDFPIPDLVPVVSHHEIGRHSVSTNAQMAGIPGELVSKMLGHASVESMNGRGGEHRPVVIADHPLFANLNPRAADLPRALVRAVEQQRGGCKTTLEHYTHLVEDIPSIEAAWFIWTELFCENVVKTTPASVTQFTAGLKGVEDRLLDHLKNAFGGLPAAIEMLKNRQTKPGPCLPGRE